MEWVEAKATFSKLLFLYFWFLALDLSSFEAEPKFQNLEKMIYDFFSDEVTKAPKWHH